MPWANSSLPLREETLDLRQELDNIEADKETRQQTRLMDCLWMSGMGFNDSSKDPSHPKDWEKMQEIEGESGKTNREASKPGSNPG